jgi:hypothetical protein
MLASTEELSHGAFVWKSDVYVLTPNALFFSTGYFRKKL